MEVLITIREIYLDVINCHVNASNKYNGMVDKYNTMYFLQPVYKKL